jgi:hypothetical protein
MWLHGRSPTNFSFEPVANIPGRTVPGDGVDAY